MSRSCHDANQSHAPAERARGHSDNAKSRTRRVSRPKNENTMEEVGGIQSALMGYRCYSVEDSLFG